MSGQRVRVRVTIEGERVEALSDALLRVRTDEGTVVCLPARDLGVSVEDVSPERVWTDGDVVQAQLGSLPLTYTRQRGEWWGWTNGGYALGPHSDDATTKNVATGFLVVLRCQADQ